MKSSNSSLFKKELAEYILGDYPLDLLIEKMNRKTRSFMLDLPEEHFQSFYLVLTNIKPSYLEYSMFVQGYLYKMFSLCSDEQIIKVLESSNSLPFYMYNDILKSRSLNVHDVSESVLNRAGMSSIFLRNEPFVQEKEDLILKTALSHVKESIKDEKFENTFAVIDFMDTSFVHERFNKLNEDFPELSEKFSTKTSIEHIKRRGNFSFPETIGMYFPKEIIYGKSFDIYKVFEKKVYPYHKYEIFKKKFGRFSRKYILETLSNNSNYKFSKEESAYSILYTKSYFKKLFKLAFKDSKMSSVEKSELFHKVMVYCPTLKEDVFEYLYPEIKKIKDSNPSKYDFPDYAYTQMYLMIEGNQYDIFDEKVSWWFSSFQSKSKEKLLGVFENNPLLFQHEKIGKDFSTFMLNVFEISNDEDEKNIKEMVDYIQSLDLEKFQFTFSKTYFEDYLKYFDFEYLNNLENLKRTCQDKIINF